MKTLAELEAESVEGFVNPLISDAEMRKKIEANRIKSLSEVGGVMTASDYADEALDSDVDYDNWS
jgi:hypothetical protein